MKSRTPVKSKKEPAFQFRIPIAPKEVAYYKTTKKTKIYSIVPLFPTYLKVLEQLQSSWIASHNTAYVSSSLIPFVITAAAALECLLNDTLIMHSSYVFGLNPNNKFAKAFLSMTLRGKLDTIVPLVTGNKYIIRHDKPTYQKLSQLIKLRNNLMHGKSFVTEHDVSINYHEPNEVEFSIELQMPYEGITADGCASFLAELQRLDKLLSSSERWRNEQTVPTEFLDLLGMLPPR